MAAGLIHVKGLDELKRYFSAVPREAGKRVLRRMTAAGAKIVKAGVKAQAPTGKTLRRRGGQLVAPGTLKAAIIIKFARERSNEDQVDYLVTARQGKRGAKRKLAASKDAYYAKWVERGHRIVARSRRIGTYHGKALYARTLRRRRQAATGKVAPHPFFAPGFAATRDEAAQAMVNVGAAEMQKLLGST